MLLLYIMLLPISPSPLTCTHTRTHAIRRAHDTDDNEDDDITYSLQSSAGLKAVNSLQHTFIYWPSSQLKHLWTFLARLINACLSSASSMRRSFRSFNLLLGMKGRSCVRISVLVYIRRGPYIGFRRECATEFAHTVPKPPILLSFHSFTSHLLITSTNNHIC